jgi:hypothetical protein
MLAKRRTDTDILPYHKQFIELQKMICSMYQITERDEKLINGKLFSLQDNVRMSSDLIHPQMIEQIQKYRNEIKSMLDNRQPLGGDASIKNIKKDDWDQKMDDLGLEILNS